VDEEAAVVRQAEPAMQPGVERVVDKLFDDEPGELLAWDARLARQRFQGAEVGPVVALVDQRRGHSAAPFRQIANFGRFRIKMRKALKSKIFRNGKAS
jgi:hypothetical protein